MTLRNDIPISNSKLDSLPAQTETDSYDAKPSQIQVIVEPSSTPPAARSQINHPSLGDGLPRIARYLGMPQAHFYASGINEANADVLQSMLLNLSQKERKERLTEWMREINKSPAFQRSELRYGQNRILHFAGQPVTVSGAASEVLGISPEGIATAYKIQRGLPPSRSEMRSQVAAGLGASFKPIPYRHPQLVTEVPAEILNKPLNRLQETYPYLMRLFPKPPRKYFAKFMQGAAGLFPARGDLALYITEEYDQLQNQVAIRARELLLFLHLVQQLTKLALGQHEKLLASDFNLELTALIAQSHAYHSLTGDEKRILHEAATIFDQNELRFQPVFDAFDQFDATAIPTEGRRDKFSPGTYGFDVSPLGDLLEKYPGFEESQFDQQSVNNYFQTLTRILAPTTAAMRTAEKNIAAYLDATGEISHEKLLQYATPLATRWEEHFDSVEDMIDSETDPTIQPKRKLSIIGELKNGDILLFVDPDDRRSYIWGGVYETESGKFQITLIAELSSLKTPSGRRPTEDEVLNDFQDDIFTRFKAYLITHFPSDDEKRDQRAEMRAQVAVGLGARLEISQYEPQPFQSIKDEELADPLVRIRQNYPRLFETYQRDIKHKVYTKHMQGSARTFHDTQRNAGILQLEELYANFPNDISSEVRGILIYLLLVPELFKYAKIPPKPDYHLEIAAFLLQAHAYYTLSDREKRLLGTSVPQLDRGAKPRFEPVLAFMQLSLIHI